jgi:hypothetical protein
MVDALRKAREVFGAEGLSRLDRVGPVEVLVGLPAFNQARALGQTLVQVGLGAAALSRLGKTLVLVADAGSQDDTPDTIQAWMEAVPSGPVVEALRLPGSPQRGRAVLAILAAAGHLTAKACAFVDPDLIGLKSEGIGALVEPILGGETDWVSPAYTRTISEGTLTTNLLAPLARALYGKRIQQLIGGCVGLGKPVIERLLGEDPPGTDAGGQSAEAWLSIGALASGARIGEAHLGRKLVAPPLTQPDLATTLARVVGPTFDLMDRYADVWTEVRGSSPVPALGGAPQALPETGGLPVERMARAFKLGLTDLLPVWEQIMPDETLGALYPLEILPGEEFTFPARLWARVVCDFALAYHERRLARDHLLRALTPLYLGRVAAFLREAQAGPVSRILPIWESIGQDFEAEAVALRSRWR